MSTLIVIIICVVASFEFTTSNITKRQAQPLLVGGRKAVVGEYPWHVGIYRREGAKPFNQICGGSLVSLRTVITATHCFPSNARNTSEYRIVAGTLIRNFNNNVKSKQVKGVLKIVVHPHYLTDNYQNDIALVIMDSDMKVTNVVHPVGLDLNEQMPQTRMGLVVGWGISNDGKESPTLQSVNLPYVDIGTCYDSVNSIFKKFLTGDKICGGYIKNNISACRGDSGGGFVFPVQGHDHQYILRGIVSIAFKPANFRGACYIDHYTAFTKVTRENLLAMFHSVSPATQNLLLSVFGVPPDYVNVPGFGFYQLHKNPSTWGEAWKTCLDEGTNLAVFQSDQEAEAVAKQFDPVDNAFLGVHDFYIQGQFVDIFGKPISSGFDKWQAGEPNNFNNSEHCVIFALKHCKLNDDRCDKKYYFLCKAYGFVV